MNGARCTTFEVHHRTQSPQSPCSRDRHCCAPRGRQLPSVLSSARSAPSPRRPRARRSTLRSPSSASTAPMPLLWYARPIAQLAFFSGTSWRTWRCWRGPFGLSIAGRLRTKQDETSTANLRHFALPLNSTRPPSRRPRSSPPPRASPPSAA